MKRFSGKVIIVTGGASGVGEATAKEFCKEGGTVIIADYNVSELDRVQSEIISDGGKAASVRTDLSDPEQVKSMIDFTVNEYRRIDVLFNNAASQASGSVMDLTLEQWRSTFNIMLDAPFLASKHALVQMVKQESGVIINTVSQSGVRPVHGMAAGSASKAALINLTKSIALDYESNGVRCVGIAPGPTVICSPEEAFHTRSTGPDVKEDFGNNNSSEIMKKRRNRFVDARPIRKAAEPEEIARAVLLIASTDTSYITGDVLFVDGALAAQLSGLP